MDHDDRARPVSGEIMSGDAARASGAWPQGAKDADDAQYETLSPQRAEDAAPARFATADAGATGMDFLKTGASAARGKRHGGPLFWAFGAFLVALAFWVSGGHAFFTGGQPAPAAAKTSLHIAGVESRVEAHDGRDVLFVDGSAENRGGRALALPPIEIAVTANDGGVTRYRLASRGTELKPGGRYAFSSRLEAPGSGVRTVAVAFAEDER
jgi:hypothetical protein